VAQSISPTTRLYARRALDTALREEYVAWAIEMLEAGRNSRNLRMLAGLGPPLSSSEVEDHFQKAIRELEIDPPEARSAIDDYACDIANRTLNGSISPYMCASELDEICHRLDYPKPYLGWVELAEIGGDLRAEIPNWLATMSPKKFEKEVLKEAREFIAAVRNNA